mmetsp:Transcript_5014/g.11639  ORF Transcript_5014/g.11639 Transcript_5014/m.11639 type:complete len:83 (+) Transcript_5014:680-928(+)
MHICSRPIIANSAHGLQENHYSRGGSDNGVYDSLLLTGKKFQCCNERQDTRHASQHSLWNGEEPKMPKSEILIGKIVFGHVL